MLHFSAEDREELWSRCLPALSGEVQEIIANLEEMQHENHKDSIKQVLVSPQQRDIKPPIREIRQIPERDQLAKQIIDRLQICNLMLDRLIPGLSYFDLTWRSRVNFIHLAQHKMSFA